MKVLVADHNPQIVSAVKEYNGTFNCEFGSPLAFDIDAVVSPANTAGVMNGGFDAALRQFFGTSLEYRVRMFLKDTPLSVGESATIRTPHDKIKWLIVAPTVNLTTDGLSVHASVAYSAAYNSIIAAHKAGAEYLGMTGLGTGAGGLNIREALIQQCEGIEDALQDVKDMP